MNAVSAEVVRTSEGAVIMRPLLAKISAVTCWGCLAAASAVWGQAWDDEDEPEPPVRNVPTFVLNEANFGQWAFGVQSLDAARSRMDAYLSLKIHDVDRACGLSDEQQEKLKLAGRGDLKRIWERVEEKRKKYVGRALDQTKVNDVVQDVQSLRPALASDPFREGTLFAKTLHGMLNDEQASRYAKAEHEKNEFRCRAFVNMVAESLDQAAGFSDEQRRRFSELVLREIDLPPRPGQSDYQVAMVQVARIPEEKLRGLFDDAQWRVVRRRLDQARGMEAALIRQGLLPPNREMDRVGAPARRTFRGR